MEFVKESLVFTVQDSPMANLMLSVMGAFAELERSLIRERQREGIALASNAAPTNGKKRPSHRNGRPSWSSAPATMFRKPSLPVTTGTYTRKDSCDVVITGEAASTSRPWRGNCPPPLRDGQALVPSPLSPAAHCFPRSDRLKWS